MDCTRLGVRPEEALFFDDSVRSIRGALELGIMTVLVSASSGLCMGSTQIGLSHKWHVLR